MEKGAGEHFCRSRLCKAHGIVLAIEAINRFETFLVNNLALAKRFVEEIDHPQVKLMADLFHMGIEERCLEQSFANGGA